MLSDDPAFVGARAGILLAAYGLGLNSHGLGFCLLLSVHDMHACRGLCLLSFRSSLIGASDEYRFNP